jgi:hypothetical protein
MFTRKMGKILEIIWKEEVEKRVLHGALGCYKWIHGAQTISLNLLSTNR